MGKSFDVSLRMDQVTILMMQAAAINARRRQASEEFKSFDKKLLLTMDGKTLAAWQSKYQPEDAQWILADQEWKRRTGISTRRIAIAAIIISALSFLIAALAYFYPKNIPTASTVKISAQPATIPPAPVQPPQ